MPLTSFSYCVPYLLFLGYLLVLMFLEFRFIMQEKNTDSLRWATIVGFLFFFGLRGLLLTDWMVYYPFFEKVPTVWDGGLVSAFNMDFADEYTTDVTIERTGLERGFIYFTLLFKSLIPNYYAWIFFNSLIDVWLLDLFIRRYSKYYVLGFIFFFVFEGIVIEVNLIRNIKAILLFLISIKYLQERRILPYMLLNILGFFFHSSAIIFLPLYFFLHKEWPKKVIWSLFVVGILLLLCRVAYLAPVLRTAGDLLGGRISLMVNLYLESDLYSGSYGLFHFGYLERVVTFILFMLNYDQLKEQSRDNIVFLNSYVIYFVIYFYFSEIRVLVERLPLLFVFSYWILYPNLYYLIKKVVNQLLFLIVFLAYSFVKIVNANSNVFAYYDNVLFGVQSYEQRYETFVNQYDELTKQE